MKQVIQSYKTGEIKLEEVPVSLCKPGSVLVKNVVSLISAGTEKLMIGTGKKSLLGKAMARPDLTRLAYEKAKKEGFISVFKETMNRLDEPVPLGYSSAGVVIEVGSGVRNFKFGDRVACAGAGFASHAEFISVPENLCLRIPDKVSFEEASFVMLGAISIHGIRLANPTFGEKIAVVGLGLIGLLTVQVLKSAGCLVIGTDLDEHKCRLAKELGADLSVSAEKLPISIEQFTNGYGADAVIITAASTDNKPLLLAENICRKRGRIVLIGVADISFTRKTMWEKEISFIVSRAGGPGSTEIIYEQKGLAYPLEYVRWTEKRNMEEFIQLVSQDKVRINKIVTHHFKFADVLKAYEMILNDKEPYIGVVLDYPEDGGRLSVVGERTVRISPDETSNPEPASLRKSVGLIGGGIFTKNILLPAMKKIKNINLLGVATTKGLSSNQLAQKFGFSYHTTDYQKILNDHSIGSVVITTPHNLHAKMVTESLKAGKKVFVEKPLCLNVTELKEIISVYKSLTTNNQTPTLMVGYNRRFSSLAISAKSFLKERITPLMLHYRINAGYIPKEHWTQDWEIGGGRIVGEICHFIDFMQFLTDSYPKRVFAESIDGNLGKYLKDDNLSISIKFQDGSLGTILYTAKGSKTFSREYLEIFSEDSVITLEDFKKVTVTGQKGHEKIKKWSQNMGYVQEMEYFFNSAVHDPKIFEGYIYTTLATLGVLESLNKGIPIDVEQET